MAILNRLSMTVRIARFSLLLLVALPSLIFHISARGAGACPWHRHRRGRAGQHIPGPTSTNPIAQRTDGLTARSCQVLALAPGVLLLVLAEEGQTH